MIFYNSSLCLRGTTRLPQTHRSPLSAPPSGLLEISRSPGILNSWERVTPSPLSAPPSPFSHKSLHRLSEDQSSCSSQINKMNFKFLLAGIWRASFSSNHNWCCCTSVFVVAVALMPTPTEAGRHLPQIPGSLASLDLINTALAASCRSGTCPTTTTSTGRFWEWTSSAIADILLKQEQELYWSLPSTPTTHPPKLY